MALESATFDNGNSPVWRSARSSSEMTPLRPFRRANDSKATFPLVAEDLREAA